MGSQILFQNVYYISYFMGSQFLFSNIYFLVIF